MRCLPGSLMLGFFVVLCSGLLLILLSRLLAFLTVVFIFVTQHGKYIWLYVYLNRYVLNNVYSFHAVTRMIMHKHLLQ